MLVNKIKNFFTFILFKNDFFCIEKDICKYIYMTDKIELLSNYHKHTIGTNDNLSILTANIINVGTDASNVSFSLPADFQGSYNLILPKTTYGISGESLVYGTNGQLGWRDPTVLKQVISVNSSVLGTHRANLSHQQGQIHYVNNYEATITPKYSNSILFVQFKATFHASLGQSQQISFYIKKSIGGNVSQTFHEPKFGPYNGAGGYTGQYISNLLDEATSTDEIKYELGYKIDGNVTIADKMGILGYDNSYNNSIVIQEYEGSGASASSVWNKASDSKGIYYTNGTVNIGNTNALNSINDPNASLKVTGNIVGNLTGDVTGNLTGDVTGNLTGDVAGNVTGDVSGNLTGAVTGNLTGAVTGNLTGDVSGNLTGDVSGNLTGDVTGNLTGSVYLTGHIIPDTHSVYDIGSAEYKIRHMYLSNNSLWIGDEHKITVNSEGKFETKKRKANSMPKSLTDNGITENKVLTTLGKSSVSEVKLYEWQTFSRLENISRAKDGLSALPEDPSEIFSTSATEDWEDTITLDEVASDVNILKGNVSYLETLIESNKTKMNTLQGNVSGGSANLTNYSDASFGNVDISGNITASGTLSIDIINEKTANNGVIIEGVTIENGNVNSSILQASNYNVGSRNVISASAQGSFTDLELKNNNGVKLLIDGDSGNISASGSLSIDTINEKTANNGVIIEGVTIENGNVNSSILQASNYNVGSRNVISASAQGSFTDLELKNNNGVKLLIDGDSGNITASGTLSIDTINEKTSNNGVVIEDVTINNGNITATSFIGDGSQLTGINVSGGSANLTNYSDASFGNVELSGNLRAKNLYVSNDITFTNSYNPSNNTIEQIGTDILGDANNDNFGMSVAISSDGKIIAAGAPMHDADSNNSNDDTGYVKVYELNGSTWTQKGNTIYGSAPQKRFGMRVQLSDDGLILAVGIVDVVNQSRGRVKIYKFENNDWVQVGQDIIGDGSYDYSGTSTICLSSDGSIVAIEASRNNDNGTDAGHIKVFQNVNDNWVQMGQTIYGTTAGDWFGKGLALSSDGTILAGSSELNDSSGIENSGETRVFQYDGSNWVQLGNTIYGESQHEHSGTSLSLSSDGNILAIGSGTFIIGTVKIYELIGSTWTLRGQPIEEESWQEKAGYPVRLSGDGNIVVIGARRNSENGNEEAGIVRIYKYTNNSWVEYDNDIKGHNASEQLGTATTISRDGSAIIAGSPYGDSNKGYVVVYNTERATIRQELDLSTVINDLKSNLKNYSDASFGNIDITGNVNSNNFTVSKHNKIATGYNKIGSTIYGAVAHDNFGYSVASSDNGNIIAVGAPYNDDNGYGSGHVKVFEYNGNDWIQKGSTIIGDEASIYSGYSVSLSSNGLILAIGAIHKNVVGDNNRGYVVIYEFTNGNWQQKGGNFVSGEAADDQFGWSVSLSSDGNRVAVGSVYNDSGGTNSGNVRVFYFDGTWWQTLGNEIIGFQANLYIGIQVSLSSDGNYVAFGGQAYDNGRGLTQVYHYSDSNNTWTQVGSTIIGEAINDGFGKSVSLSADGKILATSGPRNSSNGYKSGHVRVYSYDGNDWQQLGQEIYGKQAYDETGWQVSLSNDGTLLGVGAIEIEGDTNTGYVRMYQLINQKWRQIGVDIVGEYIGDRFGNAIHLSGDGTTVVIGGRESNGPDQSKTNAGMIRVCRTDIVSGTIVSATKFIEENSTITSTSGFASNTNILFNTYISISNEITINWNGSTHSSSINSWPSSGTHYINIGGGTFDGEFYTIPVSGIYKIEAGLNITNTNNAIYSIRSVINSDMQGDLAEHNLTDINDANVASFSNITQSISKIFNLERNEKIRIYIVGATTIDYNTTPHNILLDKYSSFSITKIA